MERLLVCGTRNWPGSWEDIAVHLPDDGADVTIIHGACSRKEPRWVHGAAVNVEVSVDMLADFIARGLGWTVEPYPIDHSLDGPWPAAGPRRNARMLSKSKPDRGIAFGALWKVEPPRTLRDGGHWKRTGTGGMVAMMLRAGLLVRWIAAPGADPVDLVEMPGPPR
jgi:hypothetical protein